MGRSSCYSHRASEFLRLTFSSSFRLFLFFQWWQEAGIRQKLSLLLSQVIPNCTSQVTHGTWWKEGFLGLFPEDSDSVILRRSLGNYIIKCQSPPMAQAHLGNLILSCPWVLRATSDTLFHFHILCPWTADHEIYDLQHKCLWRLRWCPWEWQSSPQNAITYKCQLLYSLLVSVFGIAILGFKTHFIKKYFISKEKRSGKHVCFHGKPLYEFLLGCKVLAGSSHRAGLPPMTSTAVSRMHRTGREPRGSSAVESSCWRQGQLKHRDIWGATGCVVWVLSGTGVDARDSLHEKCLQQSSWPWTIWFSVRLTEHPYLWVS